MNKLVEASNRVDVAWKRMITGPGLESYTSGDDIQAKNLIALVSQGAPLTAEFANLPGIDDVVNYLRALNAFLNIRI